MMRPASLSKSEMSSGCRTGLGVGQGAVVVGADLREEVAAPRRQRPHPVADVRQIEGERQAGELVERLLGVAQVAAVDPARPQRAGRDPAPERVRVQPDEGRLELRLQHLASAEDLHLPAFRLGLRREAHDPVAEEHEGGDPVLDLRRERGTLGQRQGQVFAGDDQVVGGVLRRGGDAQMAQVVDRVDGLLIEDAPSPRAVADHVEPPRLQPAAGARLEEQLDRQPITVALGMVVERGLEPRRRSDAVHAGPHLLVREPRGRAGVGRGRRQGHVGVGVAGDQRRLQRPDERFVAGRRAGPVVGRLGAARLREQEHEPRRAEESTVVHGRFTPRPSYPKRAGTRGTLGPADPRSAVTISIRATAARPRGCRFCTVDLPAHPPLPRARGGVPRWTGSCL